MNRREFMGTLGLGALGGAACTRPRFVNAQVATRYDGISYSPHGGYADLDFAALGGQYVSPPHVGLRLGRIGPRWVCVDKHGKVLLVRGVYDVRIWQTHVMRGTAQAGRTQMKNIYAKYGSDANWRVPMVNRLRTFHFNVLGPHSDERLRDPMMVVHIRDCAQYGTYPPFTRGIIAEAVKDVYRSCKANAPGAAESGWTNRQWGDWLDPKWEQYLTSVYAKISPNSHAQFYYSAEGDWLSQAIGGAHPDETGLSFSSGSYWCVHAGMAILWSNPVITSQRHYRDKVVYTYSVDNVNHSKRRLIDNLKKKYGTIAALNAAWQTDGYYTSFDTAGGWGVGTGVIDEDGLRPRSWFGSNGAPFYGHQPGRNDAFNSTRWAPNVKVDLDQILYESVGAFLGASARVIKARVPGALFGGGVSGVGGADGPPRIPVLHAFRDHCDFMLGGGYNQLRWAHETDAAGRPGQLTPGQGDAISEFTYRHAQKPLIQPIYPWERDDSSVYYFGSAATVGQVVRGQRVNDRVTRLINFQASDGTYPFLGWFHWAAYDQVNEASGWGLLTLNDNPYDGRDYRVAMPDPHTPGRTTLTEDRVYGDYLGYGGSGSLVRTDLVVGANVNMFRTVRRSFGTQAR